jgi:hypothetical protein
MTSLPKEEKEKREGEPKPSQKIMRYLRLVLRFDPEQVGKTMNLYYYYSTAREKIRAKGGILDTEAGLGELLEEI